MNPGLRLYQAIIDRSELLSLPFQEASKACGFTADTLASCFGDESKAKPRALHDELDRKRIDLIAAFLDCSGFRVLQMADVFRWSDYCLIQQSAMFNAKAVSESHETAAYFEDVTKADVASSPTFILDELIAATWSENLKEAAEKIHVPFEKLNSWRTGRPKPSLRDLSAIRVVAKHIDIGTPLIMMALGVLEKSDFLLGGCSVDIEDELNKALDIEIL
ncbi:MULTISPECIES: hypothetical protein [Pseudomonas]|uniref:Uncharacterized protein n=3 Tax=Pseudomonas TaxID=286 RepID=A0A3G1HJM6_PSEAI|nr:MULTISPECIES: hypothetical protein [Pseudomonas]AXQ51251.1 XRE family transcriptional regulator [Stenotrophomonas rhizophila]MCE0755683.1 XRE family transcriptional regulator [Pseudomonas asiatica]MCO6692612.1 XRE family transcriptional regulator [Pseudomonas shirazica]MCZ9640380.1 XRE family transcriptional regulator [Pseudomonas putida]AMP35680.1 Hypothetical protein [Pseudomonas aeruginosa]